MFIIILTLFENKKETQSKCVFKICVFVSRVCMCVVLYIKYISDFIRVLIAVFKMLIK